MAGRSSFRRHSNANYMDDEMLQRKECLCSVFLPGSHQGWPQYFASSCCGGDVKFHDTHALALSEKDGMAASHFRSFTNLASYTHLKVMNASFDSVLLCRDHHGGIDAYRIHDILSTSGDGEINLNPEKHFQVDRINYQSYQCFAVDSLHQRIFTGDSSGVWRIHDVQRDPSPSTAKTADVMKAHSSSILDMDYANGLLASASKRGSVCVWDVRSKTCVIAFDPATGKHLSLNQDQRSGEETRIPSFHVRFDESRRHVIASSEKHKVTVWNIRSDSAQCCFQTDGVPSALDTVKDSIYFSDGSNIVTRYSMYDAQIRTHQTSLEEVQHIEIDKEHHQLMVISGVEEAVNMFSLDGMLLGKATARREMPSHHHDSNDCDVFLTENPLNITEHGQDVFSSLYSTPFGEEDNFDSDSEEMASPASPNYEDDVSIYDTSPVNEVLSSWGDFEHSDEGDTDLMDAYSTSSVDVDGDPLEEYGYTSDSDISPRFEFVARVYTDVPCDFTSSSGNSFSEDGEY